jgi:hypothetical protein
MNRSIVFKIILTIILIAALAGLGFIVFNAGMARGMAFAARLPQGEGLRTLPYFAMPHARMYYGYGGFGFLGFLVPLFLIILIFFAIRGLFWRGPRNWSQMHSGYWGGPYKHGDWEHNVPPMFEEWHRRVHEKPSETTQGAQEATEDKPDANDEQ